MSSINQLIAGYTIFSLRKSIISATWLKYKTIQLIFFWGDNSTDLYNIASNY